MLFLKYNLVISAVCSPVTFPSVTRSRFQSTKTSATSLYSPSLLFQIKTALNIDLPRMSEVASLVDSVLHEGRNKTIYFIIVLRGSLQNDLYFVAVFFWGE